MVLCARLPKKITFRIFLDLLAGVICEFICFSYLEHTQHSVRPSPTFTQLFKSDWLLRETAKKVFS